MLVSQDDFCKKTTRKFFCYTFLMLVGKDDAVLLFDSPKEFNAWLEKNHRNVQSVWLKFYKKGSKKVSINYDQALEEALCFGWIDGIAKKYDEESYLQRFTPRRPKGNWSKRNTEHVARLVKEGRMKPSGMAAVEAAKKDGRWEGAYHPASTATIPEDFLQEIARNKKAQEFFVTLSKSNIYAIAYRLQTAKKPETLKRRKEQILTMLESNEKFH